MATFPVCIIVREKGCNHATLIGTCGTPLTPLLELLKQEGVMDDANLPIRVAWSHPFSLTMIHTPTFQEKTTSIPCKNQWCLKRYFRTKRKFAQ
ncbi:hypothetical protein Y032_0058g2904 [Ancylostoma ceylanicum]|nr:hypothetical protein Y032_0058g2904 [Ancylostoma ceylanicum]